VVLVYRDSRPVGTASVNGFDCRFTIGTGAGEARGLVCRASYCVARARTARPAAPAGLQEQLDALPDAGKALVGPAQQAAPLRHVLQRQVRRATVADPGVVEVRDVRVLQRRQDVAPDGEALRQVGAPRRSRWRLQRHLAVRIGPTC